VWIARNAVGQQGIALEKEGCDFSQVASLVNGTRGYEGLMFGNVDHGVWTAGQVQGLIHDIPTVHDLVTRIISDARSI